MQQLKEEIRTAVRSFMYEEVEGLLPTQSFITPNVFVSDEKLTSDVKAQVDMYVFAKYFLKIEVYWNLSDVTEEIFEGFDEWYHRRRLSQLVRPATMDTCSSAKKKALTRRTTLIRRVLRTMQTVASLTRRAMIVTYTPGNPVQRGDEVEG